MQLGCVLVILFFFFQAEDGIRDLVRSRGLGDVYKRQLVHIACVGCSCLGFLGDPVPQASLLQQLNCTDDVDHAHRAHEKVAGQRVHAKSAAEATCGAIGPAVEHADDTVGRAQSTDGYTISKEHSAEQHGNEKWHLFDLIRLCTQSAHVSRR
eukprot:TRINITY_DN26290_c0_g1_i1.p2 TRINITY_DN26290_c0_g1~~TRINITY_DN26290_c0_g1_i1.p2  ORF type:complete len:153 (+),score=26.00 TRINITY_DN26290_c0_g1_i1:49-507(+)